MAYQKHELLGTNKSGSTPKRGPKTIHANVKEPLAHDHSRNFETVAGTGNIARDSTVAKRHTVEVHSGMHRTTGTNDGAPVTSSLLDDEKMDISPAVDGGKTGKSVPASFGQRSRTQAGEVGAMAPGVAHAVSAVGAGALHDARHANADRIINEGVIAHGDPNHPRHPANLRRR
jgi:hypothetical protein